MFVVYQFRGFWQRTVVILRLPSRALRLKKASGLFMMSMVS